MDDTAFPCHTQGGFVCTMAGTLILAVMSGKHLKKKSLELVLASLSDKSGSNSFENETIFIGEPGLAIWVPFGHVCFAFALSDSRPSKKTAIDIAKAAKGERKVKKKKDDIRYASHIWVPMMSWRDSKIEAQTVAWSYRHLLATQACMSKKYKSGTGHDNWMKSLSTVAVSLGAEKETPEQQKKESSDDDS